MNRNPLTNKRARKKIIQNTVNVVVLFVFVIALLIVMSHAGFAGMKVLSVQSGSMSPTIPTGNLVFVTPSDSYEVNDIITFRSSGERELITHRIVSADPQSAEPQFQTQGDANDVADSYTVPQRGIVGKVRLSLPLLGYVISFAKQPLGLTLLIIIPGTIIIYEELKKIRRQWNKIKRAKGSGYSVRTAAGEAWQSSIRTIKKALRNGRDKFNMIFFILFIGTLSLIAAPAAAITQTAGDLQITYPHSPLFQVSDAVPDTAMTRSINVFNTGDEPHTVGLVMDSNPSLPLNQILQINIRHDAEYIYGYELGGPTITDAIHQGEIPLWTLNPQETAIFHISLYLPHTANNQLQGQETVFNLGIGFTQTETAPLNPVDNPSDGLVLGDQTEKPKQTPTNGTILGIDIELPRTGGILSLSTAAVITSISILFIRKNNTKNY